jgi:hypothetical protein
MNRNQKIVVLLSIVLLGQLCAGQIREGLFQVEIYGPEQIVWNPDLNSGYFNQWYRYPQPSAPEPLPWWNEWYWNDPYIPGGKWIRVVFDYKLLNPNLPGDVFITVNWTNGQWVGQDSPPVWSDPPGYDPEMYIERLSDPDYNMNLDNWRIHLEPGSPIGHWDSGVVRLPIDYNPEWVSIDVQGMGNVGIWNGVIWHECVPEPSTLGLLAAGGAVMIRFKR